MSKWKNWTPEEYMNLGFCIQSGMTNVEIAALMGRPKAAIQIKAQRFFGGNPNYRIRKTKHKHLRGPVMKYFVSHTAEETQKRFGITPSEFKSICTVSYRMPELAHLRKETRTHEPWSQRQLVFLLRHAGVRPRKWIAKKLGRGNDTCIKERLEKMGLSSRTLNGVTITSYRAAFGKNPRLFIKTDAGPGRGKHSATFFKIIPWVQVEQDLKDKHISTNNKPFKKSIACMALFQDWIFQGNVIGKMKRSLNQ